MFSDAERRKLTKVRTVTVFVWLGGSSGGEALAAAGREAARVGEEVEGVLTDAGYEVQTVRVVSNPFPEWADALDGDRLDAAVAAFVGGVPRKTARGAAVMVSIGRAGTPDATAHLPRVLTAPGRSHVSASADIGADARYGCPDRAMARAAATVMLALAAGSDGGGANFQFCASSNLHPATPFLPAACWLGGRPDTAAAGGSGVAGVALGLQHVELCTTAVAACTAATAGGVCEPTAVVDCLARELSVVVAGAAHRARVPFLGIDTSLAPAPLPHASVTTLYAALGVSRWGGAGTLESSALLTRAFKSVRGAPLVGYSGLMLPPMEDVGLAAGAAAPNPYRIHDLLMASAVCGIGLDTVPIPGDVTHDALTALLCDVATLSHRLAKPLSSRLFPVPGAAAGELTTFDNPYLCNTRVFHV